MGSTASGTGNAAPNIATTYRYTGREYDVNTGLYYYRNRWYDPETGRFISEDPIGFAGGDINLYGYVGNNPQNFVDPSGNYACKSKRQKGGDKKYRGSKGNPIAQLGDCLKLNVPGFGALKDAPRTLLESTYGTNAAKKYNEFTDYQKAVFVNTAVAAAYVKADFSSAKFGGFYSADGTPNGFYASGLKGTKSGRNEIGGSGVLFWRKVGASVEFGGGHIDVDLYHHVKPDPFSWSEHIREVNFNKKYKRGTHPGDVVKRLAEEANINTGVSCNNLEN